MTLASRSCAHSFFLSFLLTSFVAAFLFAFTSSWLHSHFHSVPVVQVIQHLFISWKLFLHHFPQFEISSNRIVLNRIGYLFVDVLPRCSTSAPMNSVVNLHRLVDEPGSTIIIRSGCNERRRDLIGRDDRPELERRRKEPIGLHRSEILMRIGI